jgi:hypothetical protein
MFSDLVVQFGTLAGVAALIAAAVNVAKSFGLPDGSAPKLSAALSLAAFVTLVALKLFAPDVDVLGLDKVAADAAVGALYILGLVVNLGLPVKFHDFLQAGRVPFIGKSYTNEKYDN